MPRCTRPRRTSSWFIPASVGVGQVPPQGSQRDLLADDEELGLWLSIRASCLCRSWRAVMDSLPWGRPARADAEIGHPALQGITDGRPWGAIAKRTLKSFYDDQMTHHAAALTYYSLMSLFPALLLALSLLGLIGQYPADLRRDPRLPARRRAAVVARAARQLPAGRASRQGHGRHDAGDQRADRAVRDDRRARGRPACAQRGLRGVRRAQLRAPQADRHRLDRRVDDADPGQPRPGLRRRPPGRRPPGLHRARRGRRARSGTSLAGRRRS